MYNTAKPPHIYYVYKHLTYSMVAMILANSAGRALGAIYNKYRLNKGFGYNTYILSCIIVV